MLVLSRKPGQKLVVGKDVVVTVVGTEGSRVTLGIEAPAGVRVLRRELLDRADEPTVVWATPEDAPAESPDPPGPAR